MADAPRSLFDYTRDFPGGMNVDVGMDPLTEDDVERWASILGASDAQRRFILAEYGRFVDRHNEFMDREMPRVLAMGVELGELWRAEGPNSHATAAQMRRVDQRNAQLRRQLTSLEHQFVDSFTPMLTPEQQEHILIVKHHATRRNCRTFTSTARWSGIELRDIWINSGAAMASPVERQRVEAILNDYEVELTRSVCERADLLYETRYRLAENRIRTEGGAITPDVGRDRYHRLMEGRLEAAQRERSLHQRTVGRMTEQLAADVAEEFVTAVKQTVFPELYPDQMRLHTLLASLANDKLIDGETHESVSLLSVEYAAEHQRACNVLEAACIEWGDNTEAGVVGYESQYLGRALKPLLKERQDLSRRYFEELYDQLGPDVLARHANAIPAAFRSILADGNEAKAADEVEEIERTAP